jgi:putative transposase
MARLARVVCPDLPHHLTQRGNRRQQVFFCDEDYQAYLGMMRQGCHRHGVAVWAYCLMPNHVHLIVVPRSEEGLRRGIGEAHRRYSVRVNRRQEWTGHLWQGRFASFVMDERHLMAVARYAEMNPVRARLVGSPEEWPWSSAAAHVAGKADVLAESQWLTKRTRPWVCTWREYLMQEEGRDGRLGEEFRRHERTGRPLGGKDFLGRLEDLLGRVLRPQKRGRKPKEKPCEARQERRN